MRLDRAATFRRHKLPVHPFDVSVASRSSLDEQCRGGDVFHAIRRPNGSAAIFIADVSTKGRIGMLQAAALRSAFIRAAATTCDPGRVLFALNELRLELPGPRLERPFASATVVSFDVDAPYFRYGSAGHDVGLLVRGRHHRHLEPTGPVLGIIREALFTERVYEFSAGDFLIFGTDGFTECRHATEPALHFGTAGIVRAVHRETPRSSRAVTDAITRAADAFCNGRYRDDATIACISRTRIQHG